MKKQARSFLNYVIQPALEVAEEAFFIKRTSTYELLLLGTAAQESHFIYTHQLGGGPALSHFQIEPTTAIDIVNRVPNFSAYFNIKSDTVLHHLEWNPFIAAILCRLHYRLRPGNPAGTDPRSLGAYWKTNYNTHLGKGTVDQFVSSWNKYIGD